MKLLIGLTVLVVNLAHADFTPTQQLTANINLTDTCSPSSLTCSTGSYSFNFDVQQFDPTLGTLESIVFDYSDANAIGYCIHDFETPADIPFQVAIMHNSTNADLGIALSSTDTENFVTSGESHCFSTNLLSGAHLSSSGNIYSSEFTGTGTVPLVFTNTWDVALVPNPDLGFGVFADGNGSAHDAAELDVTYDYTPLGAIPEPHHLWMLIGGVAAIFVIGTMRRGSSLR